MIPATLQKAPRRLQVYEFCKAECAAGRHFPTLEAIRDHMGWQHASSALNALNNLVNYDQVMTRVWEPHRRPVFAIKEPAI